MVEITSGDVLTAILFQAGGGLVLGFAAGYASKKLAKIFLLGVGLLALALVALAYLGIVTVNWDKLALLVERALTGVQATAYSIQSFIIASVPFAGSFIAGFLIGFKYG